MGTYSSQLYGIKEDAHPIFYLELYPLRNPEWRYLALFFLYGQDSQEWRF